MTIHPEHKESAMPPLTVTLAADGSIPVPPEFCRAAGLTAGDTLVLECDGHSLLVRPPEPAEAVEPAPRL
jgi:hypothetical protein